MLYLFYFLIYLYVKYPANIDAFKVKLAIYIVEFIYRSDYSVVLGLHDLADPTIGDPETFSVDTIIKVGKHFILKESVHKYWYNSK